MAVIKGTKTIAEYAIRRWLAGQGFVMEYFTLSINGNEAVLEDRNNETLTLIYDPNTKSVEVADGTE